MLTPDGTVNDPDDVNVWTPSRAVVQALRITMPLPPVPPVAAPFLSAPPPPPPVPAVPLAASTLVDAGVAGIDDPSLYAPPLPPPPAPPALPPVVVPENTGG